MCESKLYTSTVKLWGKGFQAQLQRTHGQNQWGGGSKGGRRDGWGAGGLVGGKCRQL